MRFISTRTHAVIGLIVGIALLLAPNIFGFSDVGGASVTIPRVLGILLIISELVTNNGFSPIHGLSMSAHLMLDLVAGIFLAISPWLFGFSDQGTNAWLPHLIVGLLLAGYSLVTKTVADTTHRTTHAM